MAKVKYLRVASDKSITHRAIMLSSIAKGSVKINYPLYSGDTVKTLKAVENMGVDAESQSGFLIIDGKGKKSLKEPNDVINLGNSGTSMRLLSGLIGGEGIFAVLTGDDSLNGRPMMRIIDPLSRMGVSFLHRSGGYAPLAIKGGDIKGISYEGKIASAQVKSAILLAGLYTNDDVLVSEPAKSRDHTENMLKAFGVDVEIGDKSVKLGKSRDLMGNFEINVPADISSAAYFMVYAALSKGKSVVLRDVLLNATRSGILEVFDVANVKYEILNERIENYESIGDVEVSTSTNLRPFEINGSLVPRLIDEIPIISILAIFCDGVSKIRDVYDLRRKESDRIKSICYNLNRLGVKVVEYEDGFDIYGNPNIRINSTLIDTHQDHRIAMSFLTLQAAKDINLSFTETHSILTSYPNFMDHLNYLST